MRLIMMDLTPAQKNFTLVGVLLALFLGALDQTIVATALPRIVQDLQGLDRYTWVATAYLLATTLMVPIYGKLADTLNRKSVELAAAVLFLAGSFLSPAKPGDPPAAQRDLCSGNAQDLGKTIRADFDGQYALAERALRSRDLGAVYELMADRRFPTENKKRLITGALAGGQGAEQALAAIRGELSQRADRAVAAAILTVRTTFARAVTRIFFYATFFVLAALAITVFIPELPLRRTQEPPPGAA